MLNQFANGKELEASKLKHIVAKKIMCLHLLCSFDCSLFFSSLFFSFWHYPFPSRISDPTFLCRINMTAIFLSIPSFLEYIQCRLRHSWISNCDISLRGFGCKFIIYVIFVLFAHATEFENRKNEVKGKAAAYELINNHRLYCAAHSAIFCTSIHGKWSLCICLCSSDWILCWK